MIERIFEEMGAAVPAGRVSAVTSYYFVVGDLRRTLLLSAEGCRVAAGKAVESADCVCKVGGEMLQKIWQEGYRPGVKDFLSGSIQSNNPGALQTLLDACSRPH